MIITTKKKKWPKKMVKAWKHRIEQYRYAIRKGRYGKLFISLCSICDSASARCGGCPFVVSKVARDIYHGSVDMKAGDCPCLSVNRCGIHFRPFRPKRLRARLKELIAIGRETGVIE